MASEVHSVRFYDPIPQPISCVSFNKTNKNLAIARVDASIEIWDLNYAPYLLKYIPGAEKESVQGLSWVEKRLLSTGLSGSLIEWDLDSICIKKTVLLTGYAAWCLDTSSNNDLLAVGTEQGYLNLFSVENNDIVYKMLFDKQEGRIISCKFDQAGKRLVTGSIDTIRLWNVETGQAINKISVARRGQQTLVWSVLMLSDNVIVSGDSLGRLTFWDALLGEQIESYTTHKADILSIAVTEDESSIYCSGADPLIVNFKKVKSSSGNQSENKWVKNIQRHIHQHDVKALVLNGEQLISVGDDGYLTFSSYPPKWVMRVPPMGPAPRSSVCANNKLLLLRYKNRLDIWKLGSYTRGKGNLSISNVDMPQGEKTTNGLEEDSAVGSTNNTECSSTQRLLQITEKPVKLVSIQSKNKKIICCTLSPTGEFIAFSNEERMRILRLDVADDEEESDTCVSKVMLEGLKTTCDHIAFTQDSRLMVAHHAGNLFTIQIDPTAGASLIGNISTSQFLKSSALLHLKISNVCTSGLTYMVASDVCGAIAVWTRKGTTFTHHATLPTYRCVASALAVDADKEILIIVYVDQKVLKYDLVNRRIEDWTKTRMPEEWLSRRLAVMSVTPHPMRDALVFQDDTSLWVVDNTEQNDYEEAQPRKRSKKQGYNSTCTPGLNVIPVKYLAGFHWIGRGQAVMIEISPENIVSQLPPVTITNKNMY